MIKYAHRGLAKSGVLPSLFYLLYLLTSGVFYSLWLLLAAFSLFTNSDNLEETVLKTFKGDNNFMKDNSVYRYWQYFVSSMCIFLILILIMSLGIFYSKRKSKRNRHFRQNVFTFESTLFWGLIHFGLFLSFVVSFHLARLGEIDFIQMSVLRFLMIFSHFIKSVVTIFENQENFPELFSDKEISYRSCNFNITTISPRHQNLMPFIPFHQNAR